MLQKNQMKKRLKNKEFWESQTSKNVEKCRKKERGGIGSVNN